MAAAAVATEIHQPLDVHGHFAPAITLDDILLLDDFTKSVDIVTIEIVAVHGVGKIYLVEDLPGGGESNTVYIS